MSGQDSRDRAGDDDPFAFRAISRQRANPVDWEESRLVLLDTVEDPSGALECGLDEVLRVFHPGRIEWAGEMGDGVDTFYGFVVGPVLFDIPMSLATRRK
jgi:hypothetical protein